MNNKIAILTDSNSGITPKAAKKYGVYVIAMPVIIDEEVYFEDVTITREKFFDCLYSGKDVKTSQPAIGKVKELWDELLKEYDEIIYIPMSSALSGAFQSANILANDYPGRVTVVDNHRISCTLKQSVLEAVYLVNKGWSTREIKKYLEEHGFEASIYIAVETLAFLKKGGRITKAGAAIGSAFHIKPILQIQGEKLDAYSVARTMKAAQRKMIQAINDDIQNRFTGSNVIIKGAYTCDNETADQWLNVLKEAFSSHIISLDPLSLNIASHIGYGSVAVVCIEQQDEIGYIRYEENDLNEGKIK